SVGSGKFFPNVPREVLIVGLPLIRLRIQKIDPLQVGQEFLDRFVQNLKMRRRWFTTRARPLAPCIADPVERIVGTQNRTIGPSSFIRANLKVPSTLPTKQNGSVNPIKKFVSSRLQSTETDKELYATIEIPVCVRLLGP